MFNRVHFSSLSIEWKTPKNIFEKLNQEFNFKLDAACNDLNNLCNIKILDGLTDDYMDPTFFNPPYSRNLYAWIEKAYNESLKGNTVVMLLPARTDTKWFHDFCLKGEIRFIKGRLKFNEHKGNAPFPSMVVIFYKKSAIK